MVHTADIESLVREQDAWRARCINLIASENTQSAACRAVQNSDLMARYAEGHPNKGDEVNRYYQGTRIIDQLETMAEEEIKALFGARQADVRPISGNQANTAVALGLLRAGDPIVANSLDGGGHISHGAVGVFGRRLQTRGMKLRSTNADDMSSGKVIPLHTLPMTTDGWHTDIPAAQALIDQVRPALVILGKSLILFQEPVKEIAEVCGPLGIPILYDAAHVLGLIAGKQFQQPLHEGAQLMTASTHKTFPGPQRGVILGNVPEDRVKDWWQPVDRGVFPGSSSNHHLHTIPAMVVATREMAAHGEAYAAQIVRNAQALGAAVQAAGVRVEAAEFGFTQSHQIAVNVSAHGSGVKVSQILEANDIITNYQVLPGDTDPRNPSGLRIGVQEMTRFGMKEAEMGELGQLMADAIRGKDVKAGVNALRARFSELQYV